MKLSTLVRQAAKKRGVFGQVVRTIGAAKPFADEEEQAATLAGQSDETHRFNTEKQADRAAQYAGLKTQFREAQQAFHTNARPYRQDLLTATRQIRAASQDRIQAYRTAYREGIVALDEGEAKATALYSEFAPYLRNRRWLRSYWARMTVFERIVWILLHTLAILAAMVTLALAPSWSAFLQDDLLPLWGVLWLVSLIRWGTRWGLLRILRRRDETLFETLRATYKAFDITRKQDSLARCLPPLALDLSVLTAPVPPEENEED